mgnify:CR=1 FL=1
MTPVSQRTGGDRPRVEAKRPPVGAVGRCRCSRTGGDAAVATPKRHENHCRTGVAAWPSILKKLLRRLRNPLNFLASQSVPPWDALSKARP